MAGNSRTRLIANDPYRSVFVGWSRGEDLTGPLTESWTLNGQPIPRQHTGRDRVYYDPNFHGAVTIPQIAPGSHTIASGEVSWEVEVVPPPKVTGLAVVNPGALTRTIQNRLDDRPAVLRLNPGLYELTDTLRLRPGTRIVGPGAVLRWGGKPYDGWVNLFTGGEWNVLDSLTFEGDYGMRPFEQDSSPYLTLQGCRFVGCDLHTPGPGLHAEKCVWDGGGAFLGNNGGLIRRCHFVDGLQDRYLTVWGGDRNLAIVDTHWDRPNRALMVQPRWGDLVEPLLLGLNIRDVVAADGGSEGVACEGWPDDYTGPRYGLIDAVILHYRYAATAGGGPAFQLDGVSRNGLVMDAKIGGGSGLVLWGTSVDAIRLHNLCLTAGARIQLGRGTTNTVGTKVQISGYYPTSPNFEVGHETYTDPNAVVCWDRRYPVGEGNVIQGPGLDFHSTVTPWPVG